MSKEQIAGRAVVETGVKDNTRKGVKTIEKRFKEMSNRLGRLSRKTAVAAAAIGAPLVAAAKQFASAGDKIGKFAKRTNLSTDAAQSFGFAMEQSGSNMEALEPAIKAMNRNLLDFQRGSKESKDNFSDLGIEFKQFESLDTAGRFRLILQQLQQIPDAGKRAALANKVLGRGGADLLPLLGNLGELEKEFDTLGSKMSGEQIASAEKMTDAFNKVGHQFKAIVVNVGGALAPALTDLADKMGPSIKSAIEWVKANKDFVVTGAKVAATLGGVSVALKALSSILRVNPFAIMAAGIASAVADLIKLNSQLTTTNEKVRTISKYSVGGGSIIEVAARRAMSQSGQSGSSGPGLWTKYLPKMTGYLEKLAQESAKAKNKQIGDVAAGVSQGLKASLAGMRGSGQLSGVDIGGALAGAGLANPGMELPQLQSLTAGALGSAAGIGATGGAARPMEELSRLNAEQVDLLDSIADGINSMKGKF